MVVRKKGDEWCVFSKDGEEIACHETRSRALAQLRAIEAESTNDEALLDAIMTYHRRYAGTRRARDSDD